MTALTDPAQIAIEETAGRLARKEVLRSRILDLVAEYHAEAFPTREFVPGESYIPVSGKVFDENEMRAI